MNDLKGLAARETQPAPIPTLEQLINRIGMLAGPYAFELGVDPLVSALLVRHIATVAAGIIREAQVEHIRASRVTFSDERG